MPVFSKPDTGRSPGGRLLTSTVASRQGPNLCAPVVRQPVLLGMQAIRGVAQGKRYLRAGGSHAPNLTDAVAAGPRRQSNGRPRA
jgi:hypothetical protein